MTDLSGINLNRLLVFIAVVEARSLTAAAERIGIGKTAVSNHIQRLEAEVGVNLLTRSTRKVNVTETGRDFYEACREIICTAERAMASASQRAEKLRGTLRIATPIDYGAIVVAPLLVRLRQLHPSLEIELLSADRHVDLIAGRISVAIRLGELVDSSLKAVKIGTYRRWLVASPGFAASIAPDVALGSLATLPFIGFSALNKPLSVLICGPEALTLKLQFEKSIFADTAPACRAAVLAGGGLAYLTDFSIEEDLAAGRLVKVLPAWSSPPSNICAVFLNSPHPAPDIRAFLEVFKTPLSSDGTEAIRAPTPLVAPQSTSSQLI